MKGWPAPRMWPDAECWIVGGGVSVPRLFGVPEDVIQKVLSGKLTVGAYARYLEPLHDRHVLATNMAYMLGAWVSAVYFCDKAFWLANWERGTLKEFHNLKVTDVNNLPLRLAAAHRNVKKMRRDNTAGITEERDMIKWNRNAGGGAINLAVHFGAKRILLLGYDMKADGEGRTHWHAGMPNYDRPTRDYAFTRFLRYYPFIRRDADRLGVEVLNVTEDGMSALKEFPEVRLKEVL